MKLYRFTQDFGRMGELDGIFAAEPEAVVKAIGQTVYFGEVLGKHSEVECELTTGNVVEIETSGPAFVAEFAERIGSVGHNPLDYIEE